jgi:hypothetical protein
MGRPGPNPSTRGLILLARAPMGGFKLPEDVIEQTRSMAQLGTAEMEAVRRQLAPAAPQAELKRLATVAANLRPEVVLAVADMWNNGYPGGARPSAFKGPVLLLRAGSDETVTGELLASAVTDSFSGLRQPWARSAGLTTGRTSSVPPLWLRRSIGFSRPRRRLASRR